MKKYYLHYVENCIPKLKLFKSALSLNRFINGLKVNDENFIDFAIQGKIVLCEEHYKKALKGKV